MPDSYGVGMGMMGGLGGGQGINNMMGNQLLLYGRNPVSFVQTVVDLMPLRAGISESVDHM